MIITQHFRYFWFFSHLGTRCSFGIWQHLKSQRRNVTNCFRFRSLSPKCHLHSYLTYVCTLVPPAPADFLRLYSPAPFASCRAFHIPLRLVGSSACWAFGYWVLRFGFTSVCIFTSPSSSFVFRTNGRFVFHFIFFCFLQHFHYNFGVFRICSLCALSDLLFGKSWRRAEC